MINPFVLNVTIQIKDEALTGGKWRTYTVAEVLREGLGYLEGTTLILTPTVPMNLRNAPMPTESLTTREARLRRERGEATPREAPYMGCRCCQVDLEGERSHCYAVLDDWCDSNAPHVLLVNGYRKPSTGQLVPGSAPGRTYPVLTDAEFEKLTPAWGRS